MFEKKLSEKIIAFYFIILAVFMYSLLKQAFPLFTIPVRQVFVVLVIASAFLSFLIKPNIARGAVAFKGAMVLSLPLFVMLTASLLIWFVDRTDTALIIQGLWHYGIYVNQVLAALFAASFLYMFGEDGLWYNLLALLAVNLFMIGDVIFEHGAAVYFREFAELIFSFAKTTGEVIGKVEIHELVYCTGAYLLYMLLNFKKKAWFYPALFATAFCFLSAFKRIGLMGIALALISGFLLFLLAKRSRDGTISKVITTVLGAVVFLLLLYIFLIRLELFQWIEAQGINTMGRAETYDQIAGLYEFSPAYFGRGMGFLSYQLTEKLELFSAAVHNDYLQFYIDIGFWGYLLWLFSLTILRTRYFGRGGKSKTEIIVFAVTLYALIVSSTDNTLNHQLFYLTTDMIILACGFNERVKEEDKRLFGEYGECCSEAVEG